MNCDCQAAFQTKPLPIHDAAQYTLMNTISEFWKKAIHQDISSAECLLQSFNQTIVTESRLSAIVAAISSVD